MPYPQKIRLLLTTKKGGCLSGDIFIGDIIIAKAIFNPYGRSSRNKHNATDETTKTATIMLGETKE